MSKLELNLKTTIDDKFLEENKASFLKYYFGEDIEGYENLIEAVKIYADVTSMTKVCLFDMLDLKYYKNDLVEHGDTSMAELEHSNISIVRDEINNRLDSLEKELELSEDFERDTSRIINTDRLLMFS